MSQSGVLVTLKRKVRIILVMNSGHTLNIKFPCNLGISCNNSINLNSCFSEILVSLNNCWGIITKF